MSNVVNWVLTEEWNKTLSSIKEYSNKLIEDCIFSIRVKLMLKVLNEVNKENKLSKYDEKIFEYFHHLLWHYYQTISLYKKNKDAIKNLKAKEIIEGICIVLYEQLNQFEENQQQEYIHYDKNDTRNIKNPIRIETEQIISSIKQYVLESISDMQKEYVKTQNKIYSDYLTVEIFKTENPHSFYIEVLEKIYISIINNTVDTLYQIYIDITKDSIFKLNNLQFRKAANFYYESIKQEKENLEIIVKVQVNALEDELKHINVEPFEQQKIHEILDTLIEAYQYLGKEIENLSLFFKQAETKEIELLNKDEFTKYIVNEGAKKYISDLTNKNFPADIETLNTKIFSLKNDFEQKFIKFINEIIDYRIVCYNENNNAENETNTFILEKTTMISEFIDCFLYIKEYYESHYEQLLSTEYKEILKGIYETIQIKLESIYENKNIFIESIKDTSLTATLTQEDKDIILNDTLSYWYNQLIVTHEELYNYIQEHELLSKYLFNLQKQFQKQKENLNKEYLQFLKEQLLFELTTYEEILNYSVCRLRENKTDIIKHFVETIDAVSFRLEELLSRYNIMTIKPNAYDNFDGKEHEVLMAEKQEGFSKGQIIKLVNTGYKYNNIVLIRANVIASK